MDLSVIIVNYNVKYFLEQALTSLKRASKDFKVEYFVIDNDSSDGSVEYIQENIPWVKLIVNRENVGFARANNQGLENAKGRYLLIINPDTVVGEETLKTLITFMEEHPKVGAVGPKIIDRKGKFEIDSRRTFPTPFSAFCKMTGLSALFPQSRLFAKYNLTYLSSETEGEVDALSGCFMLVRREVYESVGGFDDDYFMYGEDLDWCWRIKQAGWKVYYYPRAEIIHYGGESALRSSLNLRRSFYRAMHLFVKKHFEGKIPFPVILIRLGIYISYFIDWLRRSIIAAKAPIFDLIILNLGLFIGRIFRYSYDSSYIFHREIILPYVIYNLSWLGIFFVFGVYGRRKNSILNTVIATMAALAFLFSFTYFFKQFAYSRFVLLFTACMSLLFIPGWRWMMLRLPKSSGLKEFLKRRALLAGVDELTIRIAEKARADSDYPFKIVGFVEDGHRNLGHTIAGAEVLGSLDELSIVIDRLSIDEIIFSGYSIPYSKIVRFVNGFKGKAAFKVIPETALESLNGELPFLELGFISKPRLFRRWKKHTDQFQLK